MYAATRHRVGESNIKKTSENLILPYEDQIPLMLRRRGGGVALNDAFQRAHQGTPSGNLVRVPAGPETYWAFVPSDLPPNLPQSDELSMLLSRADIAIGKLSGVCLLLPTLLNPALIIRPYASREAVLSSRIEGTVSSLSDLFLFEAANPTPGPKAGAAANRQTHDIREIRNYIRAQEHGLELLASLPLSLRLVRELHRVLMAGVRGSTETPGEFRRTQNRIGRPGSKLTDAQYVPPPPDAVITALDSWERFLHANIGLPGLIECALMHYQFEAIHPFSDGNGRVGRLLIVMFLCARGTLSQPLLYLSAFIEVL